MKHDITQDGFAFRLRPVEVTDAAFLVELRTDPVLGRYLNPTSGRVEDQVAWTERYFTREGDYYFIVERMADNRPEGAIAIYDMGSEALGWAEWGRWILRRGSPAALESALLIYTAGFETLKLDTLYCRTMAANQPVVSFHTSCGLETARALPHYVHIGDQHYDSVEQRLTRARWPEVKPALTQKAQHFARLLARRTA